MRSLSLFAVLFSFAVSGCYLSHGLDFAPPIIPMSDAGVMPVGDAGPVTVTPDSGPVVFADAGTDAFVPMEDAGSDAGPPLPPGTPIVELHGIGPASDLTVGTHDVGFRIRSTGAPIGVKRVHVGLPVHPYNEDAPMREGWDWERRFQIGWDSITVERDGVLMDDVIAYRWGSTSNPFSNAIVLVFLDEEVVDADGHEYVMHVPVMGDLEPGDRIGFDINTSLSDAPARGSLTPDGTTFGPYGWRAPNIFTGGGACEGLHAYSADVTNGLFVWSDRTAPDHNDADCLTGGSTDWYDGTDMQMGGGYDLVVPAPAGCATVDVPADGSGHVVVRVEGGGDMTIERDTDFVAFSVIIENHTPGQINTGYVRVHDSILSDCSVRLDYDLSFLNECGGTNPIAPGSCGGGACGYSCALRGSVIESGGSIRLTVRGNTGSVAGRFQTDIRADFGAMGHLFAFVDADGNPLPDELIDDGGVTSVVAIITVP